MFIGFEDIRCIYLAVDAICLDMLNDYPEPDKIIDFEESVTIKNIKDFDLASRLYQLSAGEFVRKDRMLFPAKILLNRKVVPDSIIHLSKNIITKEQSSMKRKWISSYIKTNIKKLTNDEATNSSKNNFTSLNKLSVLYAGAAIYLGPGSMLMHGTSCASTSLFFLCGVVYGHSFYAVRAPRPERYVV
mgnify:CR=1 FL=1